MEPTLAVAKEELEARVGSYLGYGRGESYSESAWDTYQLAAIRDAITSGQRRVYYAAVVPGRGEVHNWSFLRIAKTLTLASNTYRVPLPADCTAGLDGPVLLMESDRVNRPIPVGGDVWRLRSENSTLTGYPRSCQVEPVRGPGGRGAGQRFELHVWPVADQDYTLRVSFWVHPDAITADNPFPYGGPAHAETFIASCVAAAELQRDGIEGPQTADYLRRLQTSISIDRRNKPTHFGYNADRSDGSGRDWRSALDSGYTVTFDGVVSGG